VRSEYTGEFEWYTPAEFVEAARAVLGEFDLDPASSERAQQTVKARRYYSDKRPILILGSDLAEYLLRRR
jgi:hypothetical protein